MALQVCKKFKVIIRNDPALVHRVDCYVAGVDDGNAQIFSLSERRSSLRSWTAGWKTFRERRAAGPTLTVESICNYGAQYDPGTLVQLAPADRREFSFVRLPGESRRIEGEVWKVTNLEFVVDRFCHDYAQNLLVAMAQYVFKPSYYTILLHSMLHALIP